MDRATSHLPANDGDESGSGRLGRERERERERDACPSRSNWAARLGHTESVYILAGHGAGHREYREHSSNFCLCHTPTSLIQTASRDSANFAMSSVRAPLKLAGPAGEKCGGDEPERRRRGPAAGRTRRLKHRWEVRCAGLRMGRWPALFQSFSPWNMQSGRARCATTVSLSLLRR